MLPEPISEIEAFIKNALKFEQMGDISGALHTARQALDAARNGGHPLELARALTSVARYRFRLGQYQASRQLAQEALALTNPAQESQIPVHAEALIIMGMCAAETNSLSECEHYYRQAADLARESGDKILFHRALHNLGSAVYLFRGQFDLAIAADSQALQLCRENGYVEWAVFPLITLGIAYQQIGMQKRAHEILNELNTLAQPGSTAEGYACYVKGMLALDEDNLQEANHQFEKALSLAEKTGDPSLNLDTRLGISRMYLFQNEGSKAAAWADDALNFAVRVGYTIYKGRAGFYRGRAALINGDLVSAEKDILVAEHIFRQMDMRFDLVEAHLVQAYIAQQNGNSQASSLFLQFMADIWAGGYSFLLSRERHMTYPLAGHFFNAPDANLRDAAVKLIESIQTTPPKRLQVVTLGRFEVQVGGQFVDARKLRQRHAGELLVLLLSATGASLTAEQVIHQLCPEKDPSAALDFYHHATSTLRRLLEPELPDRRFSSRYLDVSDERVTLTAPPGSVIDFFNFERFCLQNDWEQAVAIYGGEFLPMFRYSEWTISLRERLADLHERAMLAVAESRLQNGMPSACLEMVHRVLQHTSWQEHAVELGMRAALQMGDRTTAIKMYRRLEKVLDRELGILPQKEIRQLYSEICDSCDKK